MTTVETRIPQERLNAIGQRKLAQLGVKCPLPTDGGPLRGELVFEPPLVHPSTKKPIPRAQFELVGHDRLRFSNPPAVAGLPDLPFFDFAGLEALGAAVQRLLDRRAGEVQAAAAMLRLLNAEPHIDQDQLAVSALLDVAGARVEVSGYRADAMAVTRVLPARGSPHLVDPSRARLRLADFPHRADLELHLADLAQKLLGEATPSVFSQSPLAPASPPAAATTSKAEGPLTLGELVARFGAEARIEGQYQLVRDLALGAVRRRFVAVPVEGRVFAGRVETPSGKAVQEKFDLDRFPGVEVFAAALSGLAVPDAANPRAPAGAPLATPARAASLQEVAIPGETWVMNVVVEADDGAEIRYVAVDVDGKPFGAPRVLKKSDFEKVFSPTPGGGWRLRVRIEEVGAGQVRYQQIDRAGRPIGGPKQMRESVLSSNFLPEAAAY